MSEHADHHNEQPTDEVFAIATALAERQGRTTEVSGRIAAELKGEPYEVPLDAHAREMRIGRTIIMMAKIADPSIPLSFRELMDSNMKQEGYKQVAQSLSEAFPVTLGAEDTKKIMGATADEIQASVGLTPEMEEEWLIKQLQSVRQLAAEHGVSVEQVIADDALYAEAERRGSSVEDYAFLYGGILRSISDEGLKELLFKVLEQQVSPETQELLSREEIERLLDELREHPIVQNLLGSQLDLLRETSRQNFFYQVVKIWGGGALNHLTPEQIELLAPKWPLTPTADDAWRNPW